MKKTTTLLLAVFTFSCLYSQEKVKIAVFETQGTAKAQVREELKEALIDGLYNNSAVTVLDRSVLAQVMKEQGLQVSDAFDDNQMVEVGKLAGAKYICVSSINSVDGFEYTIVYRLVDVETGEIIMRERQKRGAGELNASFEKISKSKLFATGGSAAQTASSVTDRSVCDCEIATEDLPDDARIPAGWRLPTLAELECMCKNKGKIGGFHLGTYLSSAREQGYAKGIKFRFCDEAIINGSNVSRRLVRGGKTVERSGKEQPDAINSAKAAVSKTFDNTKDFVKKISGKK
ncbi:MAG: penicillin-binding protein activator LpoB [Dysgonamonadaceae bacterium]|jgi:PBP1b-binding outer membrane lipoprotein LpoB|nr:penicillin-binding protein activator LpoB [Dysgonamonadaceae bacterium]